MRDEKYVDNYKKTMFYYFKIPLKDKWLFKAKLINKKIYFGAHDI